MKKHNLFIIMTLALLALALTSCSSDIPKDPTNPGNDNNPVWNTKTHYYGSIEDPQSTGSEIFVSHPVGGNYYLIAGHKVDPEIYIWTDDVNSSNVFQYGKSNFDADYVIYMTSSNTTSYETIDDDETFTHNKYVIVNWENSKMEKRVVNKDKTISYKELSYEEANKDPLYKHFTGKAVVRGKTNDSTDKNYVHFMMSEVDSFNYSSLNTGLVGLGVMRRYETRSSLLNVDMSQWGN